MSVDYDEMALDDFIERHHGAEWDHDARAWEADGRDDFGATQSHLDKASWHADQVSAGLAQVCSA